jgi:hypothetical protein
MDPMRLALALRCRQQILLQLTKELTIAGRQFIPADFRHRGHLARGVEDVDVRPGR